MFTEKGRNEISKKKKKEESLCVFLNTYKGSYSTLYALYYLPIYKSDIMFFYILN